MCFWGSKMSINEPKMFMNFFVGALRDGENSHK